jgi:tagatose-6-phosphate ketose/aldose isomerase
MIAAQVVRVVRKTINSEFNRNTEKNMQYFRLNDSDAEPAGAAWTSREIVQQPDVWRKVQALMAENRNPIDGFTKPLLDNPRLRIILTGAGTSAFIGECLAPAMSQQLGRRVEAVSTTDLVAGPDGYLYHDVPTLLVSFARSGNSPESVAAIDICQRYVADCHHLIVTCNRQGELAARCTKMQNASVIVLPEETNDQGFAMTSSFTSMLLSAAMAFRVLPGDAGTVATISGAAAKALADAGPMLRSLVAHRFERVIYIGSGVFKGLAREAALKMLELTDGRIIATSDTSLGFRHGPKTIVNGQSLIIAMLSNEADTRRYDLDILRELRADGVAGRIIALTAIKDEAAQHPDHLLIDTMEEASDLAICLPFIVFAQSLALMQSIQLGITPDNPNSAGTVNRVVKGVTIYPPKSA